MKKYIEDYFLEELYNQESIFPMDSPHTGENKPFNPNKYKHEAFMSDSKDNICIDLDRVIHQNSKGFYDGTMYDLPVPGARKAINYLKKYYNIIIFTARISSIAHGKFEAKRQLNMVKNWLDKYDIYYDEITCEKVPASFYIDDKAIRFLNWDHSLNLISKLEKD